MFVEIEKNVFVNSNKIIAITPPVYGDGVGVVARVYCGEGCNGAYEYFPVYEYYVHNIAEVLDIPWEEAMNRYAK